MSKEVSFTLEDWAKVKPEAFELTEEQYNEVKAAEQALFEVLEKHDVPATFNFVLKQTAEGDSATEGFVTHGSIERSTIEIIMGGCINALSGSGLANMMPSIIHFVNEKSHLVTGGSPIITDRI